MLITASTIGRLLVRPRKWAQRRIADGTFGPAIRTKRAWLVDLARVEEQAGHKFTDEQIVGAVRSRPRHYQPREPA